MASPPYKLSSVIHGHNSDVRCVSVLPNGSILSGSRDTTAKVWESHITSSYTEVISLRGHEGFVFAVCFLPPDSRHPNGLIATGCQDHKIRLFSLKSGLPLAILAAHTNAVCCVSPGLMAGTLLSASWDGKASLWKTDDISEVPVFDMCGHAGTVWCVLQLQSHDIITGSADKTLMVWSSKGVVKFSLEGHADCVRGLAATSTCEFLSCGNDAVVKHWNAKSGQCLATFYGHFNFVYSIAILPGGGSDFFVTCGEDRTVRVWGFGEVQQTIDLPATSVWSVACLPNGDIVVGSSDATIRVFSCDPSRHAAAGVLLQFEEEVAASRQAGGGSELGGMQVANLPGEEALTQPGHTDGQSKLVKINGVLKYYSWSNAEDKWIEVGDVVGASGGSQSTSGSQFYMGKEYDYVFSVDVEAGKPPLKLPYNLSEDPWHAAQNFIHKNHLSQLYLDQVANFIIKQCEGVRVPSRPTTSQMSDPFTGGSRYIPGSGSQHELATANADPFTGGSRYVPSTWNGVNGCGISRGGFDPLTRDRSYLTTDQYPDLSTENTYFPQKKFIRFDGANLKQILDKLVEFNRRSGDGQNQVEESAMQEVVKLAEMGAPAIHKDLEVLKQLLQWPKDILFPVIDVTRLAVRNEGTNTYLCASQAGDDLIEMLQKFLLADSPPANHMMTLRVFCNMISHPAGEALAIKHRDKLMSAVLQILPSENKYVQTALSTLLLNLAVAYNRTKDRSAHLTGLTVMTKTLSHLTEPEAQFRCLVALGTLIWDAGDENLINEASSSAELKTAIKQLITTQKISAVPPEQAATSDKVVKCAEIIYARLNK